MAHSFEDDARRFVANVNVVGRRIADETLLVPVSSRVGDLDSIYTLSSVGARVWALLDTPKSLMQIVGVVCEEYDVSPEQASADVLEFLDLLASKNLVRSADESNRES